MNLAIDEVMRYTGWQKWWIFEQLKNQKLQRVKSDKAGSNGKPIVLIPLRSLPADAQRRYLEDLSRKLLKNDRGETFGLEDVLADPRELELALHRYQIVQEILQDRSFEALKRIATRESVSLATLYRWRDAWTQTQRLGSLVRKNRADKGSLVSFSDEAVATMVAIYNAGKTKLEAYEQTSAKALLNGWQMGTYARACQLMCERYTPSLRLAAKEGKKSIHDKIVPSLRKAPPPLPNDRWSGDHHQFDLFVRDGNRVYRPWISGWLDECTRGIIGYTLTEQPNSRTIALALRDGMLPKQSPNLPLYGIPRTVHIDNGKDYRSKHLGGVEWRRAKHYHVEVDVETKGVLAELNIQPTWAIPYNAKTKVIERFFGTLCIAFSRKQKGYCGRNPQEQPWQFKDAWKRYQTGTPGWQYDWLPWETFVNEFRSWVEWYNNRKHRTIGMTPVQRWQLAREKDEFIPCEPPGNLVQLMMKQENRAVRTNGVTMWGFTYWDDALFAWQGRNVCVRYDDTQRDTILCFDGDNNLICEANVQEIVPYGVTAEINKQMRRKKQSKKAFQQMQQRDKEILSPPKEAGQQLNESTQTQPKPTEVKREEESKPKSGEKPIPSLWDEE